MMLLSALALFAFAAACAVVVGRPGARPVARYYAVAADSLGPGTTEAWRAAALHAAADKRELQQAIARALDQRDHHTGHAVLEEALVRTRGYVPVRCTL